MHDFQEISISANYSELFFFPNVKLVNWLTLLTHGKLQKISISKCFSLKSDQHVANLFTLHYIVFESIIYWRSENLTNRVPSHSLKERDRLVSEAGGAMVRSLAMTQYYVPNVRAEF